MKESPGFALFDTAVGRCGIAWSASETVVATRLPESDDERTRSCLWSGDRVEARPPAFIATVIDAVSALVDGATDTDDLSWVPLDYSQLTEFQRSVYRVARAIPPGHTRTYGDIAAEVGMPGSARAVGRALGENPFPPIVPCHRVTAADGRTGGFSAGGGVSTKMRLLAAEQAMLKLW